jgi:hypothetical protein
LQNRFYIKMKKRIHLFSIIVILAVCLFNKGIHAQDTIFKNNGTVIYAKITEIGTNAISYKKSDFLDGPDYIENKSDISVIRFRNGQRQEFVRVEVPQNSSLPLTANNIIPGNNSNQSNDQNNSNNSNTQNNALKNGPVNQSYKIEEIDGKYMMNGQKLGRRALDKELKKSKNPLVQASLKTAKLAKISQKIVGITSIPSTIAGGITSIITISQAVTAYQTGAITPQYYVNAATSFLGTLTVPITSKYLKKQRDKLYNKTIDLYNLEK